ncbi:MAG: histidine kinase [Defluviitaleaceae bacterium]|nr:histidine kinase [Defluviitaleaceae bacterium]
MLKKINRLKLRYKLSFFIVPQVIVFILLYVFTTNLIENEVLLRITEHNRNLNLWNAADTRAVIDEMKNLCDSTLRLETPAVMLSIEQLLFELEHYENINISFANTARVWRMALARSQNIREAAIVSYYGPTVFMVPDRESFFITMTNPYESWMDGARQMRGGYYISAENGNIRVSREIICPTTLRRLGVITVVAETPFAMARFESNRLFADQQYALFLNGQLVTGNAQFCIEEARAAIYTPSPYDFILFNRRGNSIMIYYRHDSPVEIISITQISHNGIYMQAFRGIGGFVLAIMLGVLGVGAAIILAVIMRGVFKSLKIFESAFAQIERGEFGHTIDVSIEGELQGFLDSYNQMSRKLGNLITEVYEHKLTEQKLELQMLRGQINSHFLYNTLETIRMNCLLRMEEKNIQMIEYLGKILQYSVAPGSEPVKVEDELLYLDYYANLCKLRTGANMEITVFVQPILLEQATIRLLFQPIVENAIRHGTQTAGTPLKIHVTGYVDGDRAVYTVSDNGVGISKEKAAEINGNLTGMYAGSNLGLYNVHRRIQLLHGGDYGISIYPLPKQGTEVRIIFPHSEEIV